MAEVACIIACFIGFFIFYVGISFISDGEYNLAAWVGSIGIIFVVVGFDEFVKFYKERLVDNEIISKAEEYMKNNSRLYQESLSKIESFKRRGIKASYQVYDVYERNEYEKAYSIVYDYEKKKKIIDDIKAKRLVRNAEIIASFAA